MSKVRRLGQLGIVITSLFLLACDRPPKPQTSCGFVQSPEQQRVSWGGRVPIKLSLHSSVPTEAYPAIERAIHQYNSRFGRELIRIHDRGVGGEGARRDGVSMLVWSSTWDPKMPTEQARTTIYWTGSEIFEADIRINAANFSYYMGENTSFSGVDLESLVTHELGHALGLAHNVTDGSVMNFTLEPSQERRKLGDVDMANLQCEY